MSGASLGWIGIARLGLVQASLGAIVVLATATMNRVMVVELALPAMLPGALVGLHYMVQILRPRFGFGSDVGGRRTPWIVGGVATLGIGAVLASIAIAWIPSFRFGGIALAVLAFVVIGMGVGAAGTSLLVLLAKRVDEHRRAAAASMVWVMLIVGFVITSIIVSKVLDPYSSSRLFALTCGVASVALVLSVIAVYGLEISAANTDAPSASIDKNTTKPSFGEALAQVWREPQARRFTIFVFVSMLAYSAQELILEPFGGSAFGMSPAQSAQLSAVLHGGALLGMILVGIACSLIGGPRLGSLRTWTVLGCVASATALLALTAAGWIGPSWPLKSNVFALGVANGAFAVAAIGSMMSLAGSGRQSREGVRMGMWGAAQAVAFGLGGFCGAAASDLARMLIPMPGLAYGVVFAAEAILFVFAARIAAGIMPANVPARPQPPTGMIGMVATQERIA